MDMDLKNHPDCQLFVSGHNHQKGHWHGVCFRRKSNGVIVHERRDWIKSGTYKINEDTPLIGGWEVEKKFDPTPVGGYYMNLSMSQVKSLKSVKVNAEFISAD